MDSIQSRQLDTEVFFGQLASKVSLETKTAAETILTQQFCSLIH